MQNERTKPRLGLSEVLYVLGGFGSFQCSVDVAEKFDPQTNQWTIVAVSFIILCKLNLESGFLENLDA